MCSFYKVFVKLGKHQECKLFNDSVNSCNKRPAEISNEISWSFFNGRLLGAYVVHEKLVVN